MITSNLQKETLKMHDLFSLMRSLHKNLFNSWSKRSWGGLACLITSASCLAATPVEHWSAQGGTRVYLVSTPNLPMLDLQIDFDAGSRRDFVNKAGLSSAVAMMMSKGFKSSPTLPAMDENQLGEAWADLGASFVASSSQDRFSFRLRTLTQDEILKAATLLAAQQMARPAFDAKIFEREREKSIAALRESLTQPGAVAGRAFAAAIYPSHPYGELVTPESMQSTQVEDLESFYKQYINLCNARISMVGNLSKAQASQLVEVLISQFNKDTACPILPKMADVAPLVKSIEKRIDFDSAQAHVLIGQPAIDRADPDYFPLTVGNYVLGGGGFVSRLTEQVREKRALSYSVYSYFSPGKQPGPFTIGLQTRPDQALQAVNLSREVLAEFVNNGPTQAELKAAKDNLVGSFPLRLDSNKKLLDNLANIAWNDLPLNYLDTWVTAVKAVSIKDIKAAFQRHIQPAQMATVIVGGKFETR